MQIFKNKHQKELLTIRRFISYLLVAIGWLLLLIKRISLERNNVCLCSGVCRTEDGPVPGAAGGYPSHTAETTYSLSTDLDGLGRPQHARVDHASRDNRDHDRLHDQAGRDHESRDHFASLSRNHVARETNHATTSHGYLSRGTSRDHDSWPGRELHKLKQNCC